MNDFSNWRRAVAIGVVLLLGSAGVALAQETGNIYVVVKDETGANLPGVTVEISGIGAPRIQVSGAQGQARFLSLDPGNYKLAASLEGFSTVEYPSVDVRVGRNTELEVQLSSAIQETITVTSESPLLDSRKLATGTQVSQVELEKIPTARDPWAILNQTPGVTVDRVNVGGTESGQQAVFRGPGVDSDENDFLVDGVQITDMAAIGASPTYYDFDQFEEMQFSTGGSDVEKNSSGVSINMVTKRGTNEFRGSGRFLVTDKKGFFGAGEAPTPDIAGDLAPGQSGLTGNELRRVEDIGFEGGGPLVRDRAWLWGSWGQNDIKSNTANGDADDTILENSALKVNAQFSSANSAVGSWNNGNKLKFGRGAGPDRATETTWDQRGPTAVIKFEDTHLVNSNFFLSGQFSKVDGGFQLASKNSTSGAAQETLLGADGVWRNGFLSGQSSRPAEEFKVDGSYFFNTGNVNHEIKFGVRNRDFESASNFTWDGGRDIFHIAPGAFSSFGWVVAHRGDLVQVETSYQSLWVQDTLTKGNWTINAGLRYDRQEGSNPSQVSNANPAFSDVMVAVNYPGDSGVEWTDITPRVGVTYALGAARDTLLRASFAQYPDQLGVEVSRINPTADAYAYFGFYDEGIPDYWDGEDTFYLFGNNFDINNPTGNPNQIGNYDAPITSELNLSVEHALLPEFVVGATVTLRNVSDITEERALIDEGAGPRTVQPGDFVSGGIVTGGSSGGVPRTLPDGSPVAIPIQTLACNCYIGGSLLTNGGRERDYEGISLNFIKRLSNQWMLRGYFSWGEAEWSVPGSYLGTTFPNGGPFSERGEWIDGGVYAEQSGGSGNKGDVFLQSTWSYNLNGMYQVAPDRPWGFNIAANIYGREGYPLPYFVRSSAGGLGSEDLLATNRIDDFRSDDILTVDLRLEKEFAATGNVSATFSIDGFNILNENYVLQRERRVNTGNYNYLDETLSPRIFRLGFRINWR